MVINEDNIFIFIQNKENSSVKEYLLKNGIDIRDTENRTALINSAFYNNIDLLKWLIDNNADRGALTR